MPPTSTIKASLVFSTTSPVTCAIIYTSIAVLACVKFRRRQTTRYTTTMAEPLASNTLTVMPDGIVDFTQVGHQTAASVGQFQPQIDKLTADNHQQGKKALILVDVTQVTGHDPEARSEG